MGDWRDTVKQKVADLFVSPEARKSASAKAEETALAKDAADRRAAAAAAKEEAERAKAKKEVSEIQFAKGGRVSRGDGIAQRGKTRGAIR